MEDDNARRAKEEALEEAMRWEDAAGPGQGLDGVTRAYDVDYQMGDGYSYVSFGFERLKTKSAERINLRAMAIERASVRGELEAILPS